MTEAARVCGIFQRFPRSFAGFYKSLRGSANSKPNPKDFQDHLPDSINPNPGRHILTQNSIPKEHAKASSRKKTLTIIHLRSPTLHRLDFPQIPKPSLYKIPNTDLALPSPKAPKPHPILPINRGINDPKGILFSITGRFALFNFWQVFLEISACSFRISDQ
jgi:hypothetical protein